MKTIRRVVVAICLLGMAASAWAAPLQYRIAVNGLSCPFCAYGLEKKLTEVKGVQTVETDISSGSVMVTMIEGATLDRRVAAQAVEAAGFSLGGFEVIAASGR